MNCFSCPRKEKICKERWLHESAAVTGGLKCHPVSSCSLTSHLDLSQECERFRNPSICFIMPLLGFRSTASLPSSGHFFQSLLYLIQWLWRRNSLNLLLCWFLSSFYLLPPSRAMDTLLYRRVIPIFGLRLFAHESERLKIHLFWWWSCGLSG